MRIMKYVHYVYYCLLCRPPVWNSKQWTLIGIHGIPNAVQIRSRQASCPVPPLVEFGVPFKFSVNSIFWSLIVLYHLSDATCWMPFWFAAREAQSYTAEVEQSGCSRDIWFSGGWNMLELLSHTVPALFATYRDCATQPSPLTYGVIYLNPYITHWCLKLQRFRTSRCVINIGSRRPNLQFAPLEF